MVWQDDGEEVNEFESGDEDGVEGVTVNLRDMEGELLDTTTTDVDGEYEFTDLDPGEYQVEFERPEGQRFCAPDMTSDDLDSDPDPTIGIVVVGVGAVADVDDVFAGLYANADPVAVNDSFLAHVDTTVTGSVLPNDSDSDGDPLAAEVDEGPDHGTLLLSPDGTFSYVPDLGWYGTDSFTYALADGYEGADTGTVSIVVANTPAPVGAADEYETPADLAVEAGDGVLDNDTDQSNGTLEAVLAEGPEHGELTLNADGSFVYVPNADFVGEDSFSYYPTDADGPGELTTVTIDVTDTPPEAADDEAGTDEDTPVGIDVLDNDTGAGHAGQGITARRAGQSRSRPCRRR